MKITFNEDFRCFKQGDTFTIDYFDKENNGSETRILFMVGDNGSGKSTLMKSIRTIANEEWVDTFGGKHGETKSIAVASEISAIKDKVSLYGFDKYEKIFALDGELEDPQNYHNAASASDLIEKGGFYTRNMSNGQKTTMTFVNFCKEKEGNIVKGKTLILLDEVDKGWKMEFAANFGSIIKKNFGGCDVIVITHNPLSWLNCLYNIYDIETKAIVEPETYFHKKTNLILNCPFIDYTEIVNKQRNEIKELKKKLENYEKE